MILIITEFNDIPSQRVIALLKKRAVAFKSIFIDKEEVNIEADVNKDQIFIDDIDIECFTGVWMRRFNFHSYLTLEEDLYDIDTQLSTYLSNEKKKLFEYVLISG